MFRTKVKLARKLRQSQTPQEVWVWGHLRARQLCGLKFYRQYVIDPYIVDFCCPEKRVVIELDGSGHAEAKQEKHDLERDAYLKAHGWRVLRIWNSEWNGDHQVALEAISEFAFAETHSPSPVLRTSSPQTGEEAK